MGLPFLSVLGEAFFIPLGLTAVFLLTFLVYALPEAFFLDIFSLPFAACFALGSPLAPLVTPALCLAALFTLCIAPLTALFIILLVVVLPISLVIFLSTRTAANFTAAAPALSP